MCKQIFYCGDDCQKKDWTIHRIICSSYADLRSLTIRVKLAFYFPENSKRAELIKVDICETGEPLFLEKLDMGVTKSMTIAGGAAIVFFRKDFHSNGSKVNKSLKVFEIFLVTKKFLGFASINV